LQEGQVDIVLGDENGMTCAWIKKFGNVKSSAFIRVWLDHDFIDEISIIVRVAEYAWDSDQPLNCEALPVIRFKADQ
jgi:hypothetical protein